MGVLKVQVGKSTKEIASLSMEGEQHGVFSDIIYFRRKPQYGEFSEPVEVANLLSEGIGCACQAFEIAANGDYVALIGRAVTATSQLQGTWIYRSTDKGNTWDTGTQLVVNGTPVIAFSLDINNLFRLKSGRLICWGWFTDKKSFVLYSDDNGLTFNYGVIGDGNVSNALEPAFCELDDGTIIALLRNGVSVDFSIKKPALFTKSIDGGITWDTPVLSTSILDMTENNGTFIKREGSNIVEFINCSRYDQPDGHKSIYQAVFTQEEAKLGNLGVQTRILKGTKIGGDFGYPASLITDDGTIYLFYYAGINGEDSNICYLTGSNVSPYNNQPDKIDYNSGTSIVDAEYTTNSIVPMKFEQGTFKTHMAGQQDVLSVYTDNTHYIRVRQKDYGKIAPNTDYLLSINDSNFMVTINQYDANQLFISETGMQNADFKFKTASNCAYVKALIRKVNDGRLYLSDLRTNLFTVEKVNPLANKIVGVVPVSQFDFEQGAFSGGIGVADTPLSSTTRLRSKEYVSASANTYYLLTVNDSTFNVVVRQYDANKLLLADSGWQTDYKFKSDTACAYIKVLVKKVGDTAILPTDVKNNLFTLEKVNSKANDIYVETGTDVYTCATPLTDFIVGTTYSNVSTSTSSTTGSPEGLGGSLITYRIHAGAVGYNWQEYHIYGTNKVYRRYFDASGNATAWFIDSISFSEKSINVGTLNAGETKEITIANTLTTDIAVMTTNPKGDIPLGVVWNCVAKNGSFVLRVTNVTNAAITVPTLNWVFNITNRLI